MCDFSFDGQNYPERSNKECIGRSPGSDKFGLEYTNKNARSRVFLWLQFGTTDRLEGKFYRYMTMKRFTFLSICVRNVSLIVLKQEQGWKYN